MIRGLLLLLTWLPLPALAADIVVRAGEHGTFTRLVLHAGDPTGWTLAQDGASVVVSLPGGPHRFDTRAAFERISRNRIAALRPEASGLRVDLACQCKATGFVHAGRLLVVDIAEEPEPPGGSDKVPEAPQIRPPAPAPPPLLPVIASSLPSRLFLPSFENLAASSSAAGLVDLERHLRIDRADLPDTRPLHRGPASTPGAGGSARSDVFSCPPDAGTLTRTWAGVGGFPAEKARHWRNVVSGTGEISESARLQLARFYVANALAPEARRVLPDGNSEPLRLVQEMARVIDGRPAAGESPFRRCPGFVIWAFLDDMRGGRADRTGWETGEMTQSFRDLSPVLQNYFFEELVASLRKAGLRRDAERIEGYRRRTLSSDVVFMPDGEVDIPPPAAQADSHPETPAERLLQRMATLQAVEGTTEEQRGLIESFLIEYRGSRLEPAIWQATIRARLVSGRLDEALELMSQRREDFPDAFAALVPEVTEFMVTRAPDIAFLKMALAMEAGAHAVPRPRDEDLPAYAERLARLGF